MKNSVLLKIEDQLMGDETDPLLSELKMYENELLESRDEYYKAISIPHLEGWEIQRLEDHLDLAYLFYDLAIFALDDELIDWPEDPQVLSEEVLQQEEYLMMQKEKSISAN